MQMDFFLVFKMWAILKDFMIFLNEFFFQTILVSKDVEFNEKLHDI